MRQTNFVRPLRARPGLLAAMTWAVAAGLAAVAVWAYLEAGRINDEADRLQGHAVRLGQSLDGLAASDGSVPSEAEISELAARIDRLNTLSGPRHIPLPRLLEALEEALPADVWVGQLTYSSETGAFAVSLMGEDETVLPTALRRIEALPALSDVILERQVRVQGGTRNLLQYDIRARAK